MNVIIFDVNERIFWSYEQDGKILECCESPVSGQFAIQHNNFYHKIPIIPPVFISHGIHVKFL